MTATATGPAVELARYRISAGERVVLGQRIRGVVRVTDRPADGQGRSYLVERELTSNAELQALVADYVEQAAVWDAVPVVPCWLAIPEHLR
jgi:hypothetical protein